MNGTDDIGMLKELVRREQESINSNRRYSSLSRDITLTTAINEHIQHEEENLRVLRGLAGDEFEVDDDVFEEQVYHDQPGGPNVSLARTDSLLAAKLPPDVASEDPAILAGAKEAARLMVGSYAAAISQAVDSEVGEALEPILRDCEDYLRTLERYRI